MFFSSKTIEALLENHKLILKQLKALKDIELSIKERKLAFEKLIPILISHNKREEKVIYNFMLTSDDQDLRIMALEGEEEHKICSQLIAEMDTGNELTEEWSAKARVLSEIVEHHLEDEKLDVFPILKNCLDNESDSFLFYQYNNRPSQVEHERL